MATDGANAVPQIEQTMQGKEMKRLSALIATGIAASIAAALPLSTHAQAYPARPVTLVVPFAPGGGSDTGARIVAQKLTQRWGQTVLVENKPGAAGMIGADYVARSNPDGYTLLIGNIGTQSINQSLYKKIAYNAETAFAPVSLIAELPLVLTVNPSVPAKTARELGALAKNKPGDLAYSTSGAGSAMHLAAELFQDGAGVKLLHVPYKGGGPAVQDLLAGQVALSFPTLLEASSHIKSGKLRALAVTGSKRAPALPDVPTVAESYLPGYNSVSWIGVLAPARTPAALVDKISKDIAEVVNMPEVREKLIGLGAVPMANTPAEFQKIIDDDRIRYAKLIKEKNISAD
jgi:tripartite-type tricarboxylate transporter receptor subunit TctC